MSNRDNYDEKVSIIGKATFVNFEQYVEWCLSESADKYFTIANLWTDCMYNIQGKVPGINFSRLFDQCKVDEYHMKHFGEYSRKSYYVEPLQKCVEYMNLFSNDETQLKFNLLYEYDGKFDIIGFGSQQFIVPQDVIKKEYPKDYSNISLSDLRNKSLNGKNTGLVPVDSQLINMCESDVQGLINQASLVENQYKQYKDDINNARIEGLEGLQKKIDTLKQELEERKQSLLAELEKKENELQAKMAQLKGELFMLESEIYSIRCFLGEVVDFIQLRKGNPAPVDAPITLFQKMRFLDDELGKLVSVYDFDFNNAKLFEQLLKERDDILDVFCPNDKCVSLVRVSKTNTTLGYDGLTDILKEYEVYHGLTIGILIRNGENVYMGWTDDQKISIPDDMFYTPGKRIVNGDDAETIKDTSIEEAVSRYFIFSILQGTLQNKQMLQLPESVKADFTKPSQYIIYSVADTWLCDNRYGTFAQMIDKCNSKISEGDVILALEWNTDKDGYRGHSDYRNMTSDVRMCDRGIYTIRLIEENNDRYAFDDYKYYISLKKYNWDFVYRNGRYVDRQREARALFRVFTDEFINLTYMNSTWLKYVITTKNIGSYNLKTSTFAQAIRYLNDALKYIKEREAEELTYLTKYVNNINDDTWVLLTEFKLEKNVRRMNDYQAKRFAKWLRINNK